MTRAIKTQNPKNDLYWEIYTKFWGSNFFFENISVMFYTLIVPSPTSCQILGFVTLFEVSKMFMPMKNKDE